MQRHRVLVAFAVAWLSALALSWWVYRTNSAPQKRDVVSIVVATKDLPLGKRVEQTDVKLATVDRQNLPKGAFLKAADAVDRGTSVPMTTNEPILATKLAVKGSGEGLTSLIEPGTRAISVQVNEISGVSGFIQPGTRVDVLFTRLLWVIAQREDYVGMGIGCQHGTKHQTGDAERSPPHFLVLPNIGHKSILHVVAPTPAEQAKASESRAEDCQRADDSHGWMLSVTVSA